LVGSPRTGRWCTPPICSARWPTRPMSGRSATTTPPRTWWTPASATMRTAPTPAPPTPPKSPPGCATAAAAQQQQRPKTTTPRDSRFGAAARLPPQPRPATTVFATSPCLRPPSPWRR
ncbi:unnamed protein product, partial [Ectocarpus sp. 4 AP-2014]